MSLALQFPRMFIKFWDIYVYNVFSNSGSEISPIEKSILHFSPPQYADSGSNATSSLTLYVISTTS